MRNSEYVDNNTTTFCENIRILARKNNIRIRELEEDCGLSIGYLSKCVSGKHSISLNTAINLLRYINDPELVGIDDVYDYSLANRPGYSKYASRKTKKKEVKKN